MRRRWKPLVVKVRRDGADGAKYGLVQLKLAPRLCGCRACPYPPLLSLSCSASELLLSASVLWYNNSMFWLFLLVLVISAVICPILFSLWLMPTLLGMSAVSKINIKASEYILLLFIALTAFWQLYYWVTWATWCSFIAYCYMAGTHYSWIYYLIAFMFCIAPFSYLTSAEMHTKQTDEEVKGLLRGSTLYGVVLTITYIGICVWPKLITVVFWWLPQVHIPA